MEYMFTAASPGHTLPRHPQLLRSGLVPPIRTQKICELSLCHYFTIWSQASHLTCLSLPAVIYKVGIPFLIKFLVSISCVNSTLWIQGTVRR